MYKEIKLFGFIFISFLFFQSCLVSRTRRPKLTGYIFDIETKQPIKNCKVGETKTDSTGFFLLKEKRYLEFTIPGYEAPPVFIQESIYKQGYKPDMLSGFNKYGGGARRGVHWEMDTVYLKK